MSVLRVPHRESVVENKIRVIKPCEEEINCLQWSGESLIYGHSLGISILQFEVLKNLPNIDSSNRKFIQNKILHSKTTTQYIHIGQKVTNLDFIGSYAVVSLKDNSLRLISFEGVGNNPSKGDENEFLEGLKMSSLGGISGHSQNVNSVAVSQSGVVASTGDDKVLLIWENGIPVPFSLDGVGNCVKFLTNQDVFTNDNMKTKEELELENDSKIALLENGVIRILNWRKSEWLIAIFPFSWNFNSTPYYPKETEFKINSINVSSDGENLIAIGDDWWKKWKLDEIKGGCGFTRANFENSFPFYNERLYHYSAFAKYSSKIVRILINDGSNINLNLNNPFIKENNTLCSISFHKTDLYDARPKRPFTFLLPSPEVTCFAMNGMYDVLAVVNGSSLLLILDGE